MSTDIQAANNELMVVQDTENLVLDVSAMKHMMDVATFMSKGTLTLPEPYRNNPANCLAVVMQAAQWKMNPFAVAQKTHFVNGNIGYEAQLVAAVINQSGATKDNFSFEWFGDWTKVLGKFKEVESKTKKDDNGYPKKYKFPDWKADDEVGLGVKVLATLKGEDSPRELSLLLTQANTRNSTLWADDPRQQIAYLAQKRWARLYAPGVILGVYSPDEVDQFAPKEKDITPIQRTGKQAAEEAKKVVVEHGEEEERDALIKSLQEFVKKGLLAYGEKFLSLTKHERLLVGTDQHESFKKEAQKFDDDNAQNQSTKSFVDELEQAEANAK